MNDEINNEADVVEDEDLLTTPPNPQPSAWKMPDPVFRKTSGRLPEAFENLKPPDVGSPDGSSHDATDVIDDPVAPTSYVEPKPKSPTLKIVVVVLGLAAMIAFIAVFLTVIYFLFFR